MTKGKRFLLYSTLVVVFLFLLLMLLVKAQALLIPFTTAVILAMLVLPLSQKLESLSVNRTLASFLNTIVLLLISIAFLIIISFQVKNIMNDWGEIRTIMKPKLEQLREFILVHFPMSAESIDMDEKDIPVIGQKSGAPEGKEAFAFFNSVLGFMWHFLLTFVYIFFLLNYRSRFKKFLLQLFPKDKNEEVRKVIKRSTKVTQQYLVGKTLLITILAVLYSVGLGISGVENFIIISILAAVLSIIPYIGNVIGFGIAMTYGFITSGETALLVGIIITFSVAQFVESYILEPYVVGDRVDLHPFFVILAAVLGNSLWGIMGMILAIPVLAIFNVILLDIPSLRPFGFLLSNKPPSEKV